MLKETAAFLSEHRFSDNNAVLFSNKLKVTLPATIFPLTVLTDMIRSTLIIKCLQGYRYIFERLMSK